MFQPHTHSLFVVLPIKVNNTITDLILWNNKIGDAGTRHIGKMLEVCDGGVSVGVSTGCVAHLDSPSITMECAHLDVAFCSIDGMCMVCVLVEMNRSTHR